jgi:sialate O-acetylesterase
MRYGYPSEYSSPMATSARITDSGAEGTSIEISFTHAAGLVARDIGKGLDLRDFMVVDADGKELEAKAGIIEPVADDGEVAAKNADSKILLKSDLSADKIKKVRYLVSYTYSGAMIYNKANLPMGPFELDVES